MDQKSKILLILLAIAIIISVCFTYYRTMVTRDFEIINPAPDRVTPLVLQDSSSPGI